MIPKGQLERLDAERFPKCSRLGRGDIPALAGFDLGDVGLRPSETRGQFGLGQLLGFASGPQGDSLHTENIPRLNMRVKAFSRQK